MAMVSRPCYVTGSGANFAVYQSLSVKLKNERTQTLIVHRRSILLQLSPLINNITQVIRQLASPNPIGQGDIPTRSNGGNEGGCSCGWRCWLFGSPSSHILHHNLRE